MFAAKGADSPPAAKYYATVVLIRVADGQPQCLLVRRCGASRTAPGRRDCQRSRVPDPVAAPLGTEPHSKCKCRCTLRFKREV